MTRHQARWCMMMTFAVFVCSLRATTCNAAGVSTLFRLKASHRTSLIRQAGGNLDPFGWPIPTNEEVKNLMRNVAVRNNNEKPLNEFSPKPAGVRLPPDPADQSNDARLLRYLVASNNRVYATQEVGMNQVEKTVPRPVSYVDNRKNIDWIRSVTPKNVPDWGRSSIVDPLGTAEATPAAAQAAPASDSAAPTAAVTPDPAASPAPDATAQV